jgi:hypothetical protein
MRDDFISNESFTPEVFDDVFRLRDSRTWPQVDRFMGLEYGVDWLRYLASRQGVLV